MHEPQFCQSFNVDPTCSSVPINDGMFFAVGAQNNTHDSNSWTDGHKPSKNINNKDGLKVRSTVPTSSMARLVLLAWSTAISIISVNVWQHIISFSKCHSRFRNYQLYMLQVTWDTGLIPPRNLKEQPKHVAASNFMEENTTSFKQARPLHLTTKPFPINNWTQYMYHYSL